MTTRIEVICEYIDVLRKERNEIEEIIDTVKPTVIQRIFKIDPTTKWKAMYYDKVEELNEAYVKLNEALKEANA